MNINRITILTSFILTIFLSRIVVYLLATTHTLQVVEPHVGMFRIHHITTGLIIIAIAGYCSLAFSLGVQGRRFLSAIYGFGLALVVDEIVAATMVQSKYWNIEYVGVLYGQRPSYIAIALVAMTLGGLTFLKLKHKDFE